MEFDQDFDFLLRPLWLNQSSGLKSVCRTGGEMGMPLVLGAGTQRQQPLEVIPRGEKKAERYISLSINDSVFGVLKSLTNGLINHGLIVRSPVGKSKFSTSQLLCR